MKVSELAGALLDYWVARAEGFEWAADIAPLAARGVPAYSTDWAHGGPLIDEYRLAVSPFYYKNNNGWVVADADDSILSEGSTALEAVCREVVRRKFGDEVPDETPEPR